MRKTHGAWRLAGPLAICAALAGCSGFSNGKSWELVEQQQEQRALAQKYELDQMRRNAPDEPALMLGLIRETQAQRRYFASLAYIDAYMQQFGQDGQVLAMRAHALRMTGQWQESEAAYRRLLDSGQAAQGWHGLGLLAGGQGEYLQAAQHLAQAARLAPTNAEILSDLGYARLRAGQVAQARLPLGQAAELAPGNQTVLANLALWLLVSDDAPAAQHVMAQARLSEPARQQVARLADDIRAQPVASAEAAGVTETAAVSVVTRSESAMASPSAQADRPATAARTIDVAALPRVYPQVQLQRRVLEGFGNPALNDVPVN